MSSKDHPGRGPEGGGGARRPREGPWAFEMDLASRWLDNDQYGHINNSVYYLLHDTIVNLYLAERCGIKAFVHDPPTHGSSPGGGVVQNESDLIGLVVSSSANYFAPTSFPCKLRLKLRVVHLGSSSVRYECGIFEVPVVVAGGGEQQEVERQANVVTQTTHVFVHRYTRRPVKLMPERLRSGLQHLIVPGHWIGRDAKL
ncbi:hypothetical protein IE53DRAFT_87714 [Violaceomyces palustris]|uniref:Uncharacterized protein n=1 Tax=Violaceomyces palustris TaxID=1673888 RepID=A0ACD0NXT5_9BASI|nr:hypothetical protein IE53DRAFT_87714 [Violaceomyces palustris]